MSHTYSDIIEQYSITISVNQDWSGEARVTLERRGTGSAQAVVDARKLLLGLIVELSVEAGEILSTEWPMIVAVAVRGEFRDRAIAALEDL